MAQTTARDFIIHVAIGALATFFVSWWVNHLYIVFIHFELIIIADSKITFRRRGVGVSGLLIYKNTERSRLCQTKDPLPLQTEMACPFKWCVVVVENKIHRVVLALKRSVIIGRGLTEVHNCIAYVWYLLQREGYSAWVHLNGTKSKCTSCLTDSCQLICRLGRWFILSSGHLRFKCSLSTKTITWKSTRTIINNDGVFMTHFGVTKLCNWKVIWYFGQINQVKHIFGVVYGSDDSSFQGLEVSGF